MLCHTDPAFEFRIYARTLRRDPGERQALKALTGRHFVCEKNNGDPPAPAQYLPCVTADSWPTTSHKSLQQAANK
jgi:hypothetical protein